VSDMVFTPLIVTVLLRLFVADCSAVLENVTDSECSRDSVSDRESDV
jgi:hypothetical protein